MLGRDEEGGEVEAGHGGLGVAKEEKSRFR